MRQITFVFFVVFAAPLISYAALISDSGFKPTVKAPTFSNTHPVICFDQGHQNYKPDDGRYIPVFGLLESDGYKISIIKTSIDSQALQSCEIFYISAVMPNERGKSAFNSEEIEIIKNWVRGGGSLLLMTDHPNDFAQAPESLANAFGVHGSLQTVEDPVHTIASLQDPTVIVFSKNEMNKRSAIVNGRDNGEHLQTVVAFTGQSLHGPSDSDNILFLSDKAVQSLPGKDQPKTSAKGWSMMLAVRFGKGRAIVTGDGTFFSSKIEDKSNEKYGINRGGTDNIQLALNTFHWLLKKLN